MELKDRKGRLAAYAFRCGYVERLDGVEVSWQHCCYFASRASEFGRMVLTARSLTEIRTIAAEMRRTAIKEPT